MTSLQSFPAKICLTAAGCLIHDGKILLVKHKKLGFWLNPGGHLEPNELPHQAAEREFFEETGIRVKAYTPAALQGNVHLHDETGKNEYLPLPIATNLHWVSRQNYDARTGSAEQSAQNLKNWGGRGCEQHYGELYLVHVVLEPGQSEVTYTEDVTETDGIAWFTPAELETLETPENIKIEAKRAFEIMNKT
jgi:8-oxo-dGTP pyrophosphatase MutT (NUDIX family)